MPDEAERPIEKLLRACAKRRRTQQQAVTLHPATRRLLQGEVARVWGSESGRSTSFIGRVMSLSWGPKLAWSAGVFLVLVVASWSIISSQKISQRERLQARNGNTPQQTLPNSVPQLSEPAAAPSVMLSDARQADNQKDVSRDRSDEANDQLARKPEVAVASPAEQVTELKKDADTRGLSQLAVNAPAGSAAPVIQFSTAASGIPAPGQNLSSAPARPFVQESTSKAKAIEKEQRQPILDSFQWEQSGSEIRVTDQDGSVYAGSWQTAPRQLSRVEPKLALSSQTKDTEARLNSASRDRFFQVTGTNRSLQTLIVFSGRLSVPTNSALSEAVTNMFINPAGQSLGATTQPLTRISGTAVIRGSNQITINAVSARP